MSAPASVSAARTARLVGDVSASRPAYRALADALRRAVADGRIPVGAKVPSERDLTTALEVSRTTVTRAYDLLRESGYLVSRRGSGSVTALPHGERDRASGGLYHREVAEGVLDLTCAAGRAPAGILEAYERALERLPAFLAGTGYLTVGVPELREVIAARYTARGLPTTADQVLVTSGSLAAVGIAVRAVVGRADRVLVENPSFPNTVDALRGAGARLTTLAVDPEGWDLEEAQVVVRRTAARAAFLIPDFHNPTGALLDDAGRAHLAASLDRVGTVAVVDESVVDIDLSGGEPLPLPFAAHSPSALLVGGASKSHWGGLRTGWLRVPRGALTRHVEARVTGDLGAPVLEQLVLLELLRERPTPAPEHLDALRTSRTALAQALRRELPDLAFTVPRGGLSLWCALPDDLGATALAAAAEDEGLVLAPGPRFAVHGGLDGRLRLPHALPPETMTEVVTRLARAAARLRTGGRRPVGRGGVRAASGPRPIVA
ncbi:MocR-like transcription factor YczR [Phycicoccus flavus]|uniref:MocR-like transcription factor YczR n=1 Tax=Phycicoccus flavus TaxID=2502783 RepID=UPI000FEBE763|nr:PLP-dependent aminotransferase family protein [Phycicoccus flavus]NHA67533.1 PLP-dependent aminotransferase family protein [Phycicoccus flavus]